MLTPKKGDLDDAKSEGSSESESGELHLVKTDSSEGGLWQRAWKESSSELAKMLPPEFQPVETLDIMSQVQDVRDMFGERARNSEHN